jgi:hypothetical protein
MHLPARAGNLMSGQYGDPVRVVAFNTAEHWSEEASGPLGRRRSSRAARGRARFENGCSPSPLIVRIVARVRNGGTDTSNEGGITSAAVALAMRAIH